MLTIDGSYGEGGGQILRTSLCLSLITGKPFRIENIRAHRKTPGLRKQHVTCVRAAARIGGARLEGAKEGSKTLVFEPSGLHGGTYRFAMSGAGSTSLVLQSVLPALLRADGPTELVVEGGTHNPMAPPFDFLKRTFLPLLKRMGASIELEIERPGFYPKGGGRVSARIRPSELGRLDLQSRGEVVSVRARALISNLPRSIADRELNVCRRKLQLKPDAIAIEEHPGKGPGNVVFVDIECERLTEIVTGFGEKGVKAEAVAEAAAREAKAYLEQGAPVGEHLADQLLIYMALARGGSYRTGRLSSHTTTNIQTIESFLDDVEIVTEESGGGTLVIVDDKV